MANIRGGDNRDCLFAASPWCASVLDSNSPRVFAFGIEVRGVWGLNGTAHSQLLNLAPEFGAALIYVTLSSSWRLPVFLAPSSLDANHALNTTRSGHPPKPILRHPSPSTSLR